MYYLKNVAAANVSKVFAKVCNCKNAFLLWQVKVCKRWHTSGFVFVEGQRAPFARNLNLCPPARFPARP